MELKEARDRFIEAWGAFGSAWGINRSMAQVHALLMVSHAPLSTEDVMDQLNISRGNANMNLRALIDRELTLSEGRVSETCQQAFDELTTIYHADRALDWVAPPKPRVSR